jgi:hypothetical protein
MLGFLEERQLPGIVVGRMTGWFERILGTMPTLTAPN